tara:strand:+ start:1714 stop:2502 length:789 start_codon:yes stop_codon:yes gene_type:complete
MFKKLVKIPIFKKIISSLGIRVLKLLNMNRGYFKIKNINMFLDFLDPIDREIIISQEYEKEEISILTKLIENHDINYFIDIGSNCGIYSFMVSLKFKNLRILAFEPNTEAFQKFKKTLDANANDLKNIKIFNYGLSDKKSKLKMRSLVKYGYVQTGGSTVHDEKNYDNVKIYDAEFEIGDQKLSIENSNIAIKIDVEGHESNVLLGLKQLLTKNNCILQIELFKKNFTESNQFLIDNNFKMIFKNKSDSNNNYKNYFYTNIA